jgi:hypothetical protein
MLSTDHVAHVRQCNFYGVTPLSGRDIVKLHAERLSGLDAAFSVASDLACGFAWREAIDAYKRAT